MNMFAQEVRDADILYQQRRRREDDLLCKAHPRRAIIHLPEQGVIPVEFERTDGKPVQTVPGKEFDVLQIHPDTIGRKGSGHHRVHPQIVYPEVGGSGGGISRVSGFVLHQDAPAQYLDELDIDPLEQGLPDGITDGIPALLWCVGARNGKYGMDTNEGIKEQLCMLVNGRKVTSIEKKAIRAESKDPGGSDDLLTKEKGIQFEALPPAIK